jgi:iron complex transport system substrate-binding protein
LRDYDWPVHRAPLAVVVGACALAAAACGERGEPVGPAAELYPLTVTADEQELAIPAPPQRIVVLRGAEALVGALGLGARVVGDGVSAEEVGSLRPDLVVAPSATDEAAQSRAAAGGAPLYLTPDTSITEVERAITQLGLIAAEPATARRQVREVERRRQLVAQRLRGAPRVTVFVDVGRRSGAGDNTLIGDLVREAGGTNVVATAAEGTFGIDELARTNPRVYIATSDSGTTLRSLRRDPRTRKLAAVRLGNVVVVDTRLLEPGAGIGRGLEALARALHPEAFD